MYGLEKMLLIKINSTPYIYAFIFILTDKHVLRMTSEASKYALNENYAKIRLNKRILIQNFRNYIKNNII